MPKIMLMNAKKLLMSGLAASLVVLPCALKAKEKMKSDFKFKTGMIRVIGNSGELGVKDAGPLYFPGTKVVEFGILDAPATANQISIEAGREVWFHKNGLHAMVEGFIR